MNTESEINKLETLRSKYGTVNAAIVQARNEIVRCHREIGEARIAAALDSEANPPKTVEARCRKFESELKAAQAEIEKLTPEAAALSGAIDHLEREIAPKRHAERLNKQVGLMERYTAIARRILEAANALAAASTEAKSLFDSATLEFPKDEQCEGQGLVRQAAGLVRAWDPAWISYGQGSRRDVAVAAVYDFDPTLVDETDPVACMKRHDELQRRELRERAERERAARLRQDGRTPQDEPAKAPGEVRGKVLIPNPQNPNWFRSQI
jgi:hypothetical protein